MPKFARALARIVCRPAVPQQPAPRPGEWERLATEEERAALFPKTDVQKAA